MRSCAQSSQRSTWPPSAAVRQVSIADITFNWREARRDRRWPCATPPHGRERRRRPPGWTRDRAMRPRSGGRRSAREVDAQPLERALDVADRVDGDAGVERRRLQLGVSEQDLDHPNVDALFEQMGSEGYGPGCGEMRLRDAPDPSRR